MTIQTSGVLFTHPKDVAPSGYINDPERAIREDALATSLHDPDANQGTATHEGGNSGTKKGNPDIHDWNKRYSNLKSYSDKKINELTDLISDLQVKLEKAGKQIAIPKTAEELSAWREQYSDLYDVIRSVAIQETATVASELQTDIARLNKQREDLQKENAREKVLAKHPDAFDLPKDPDFIDWYHAQSKGVQELINSSDALDVIRIFDLYKLENGIKDDAKADTSRDASKAVKTGSRGKTPNRIEGKVWTESEIIKLNDRQFREVEKELDLAEREGRILYDITNKTK